MPLSFCHYQIQHGLDSFRLKAIQCLNVLMELMYVQLQASGLYRSSSDCGQLPSTALGKRAARQRKM
jgi:hypothetical protein